ncbi:TBC1 domain family member 20-like [Tropilaelaps mercedesae]|uniref:TBC1 domain family member 20-like n=1 Tax=Tropilaelaps mercedesae TaxID=418985 RepID=A0A1V9XQA6_9ACAR|nr:TBC1 domain family member 20-like [Tropilaelaps mercedesae]
MTRNASGELWNDASGEDLKSRSSFSDSPPLSPKYVKIINAIATLDEEELKFLARDKGGLLDDELRKKAWPILLRINMETPLRKFTDDELKKHDSFQQVGLDVDRLSKRFPHSITFGKRVHLQQRLKMVILRVLSENPHLHYYQGYHDVGLTILLVFDNDEDLAVRILNTISNTKLFRFMGRNMDKVAGELDTVFKLIGLKDATLEKFLKKSECGVMFCLSWVITWFAHDIENYSSVVRLFDFFIADFECEAPIHFATSLVLLHSRTLQLEECSMANMHSCLSKLPTHIDNKSSELEDCVELAHKLFLQYPRAYLEALECAQKLRAERMRKLRENLWQIKDKVYRFLWSKRTAGLMIFAIAIAYQTYRRNNIPVIER